MPNSRDVDRNGKHRSMHLRMSNSNSDIDLPEMGANRKHKHQNKSRNSVKKSKKNKKRSRDRELDGESEIHSVSSSLVKPLVEYSDVSSDDLSGPEAGEIQSEESVVDRISLSEGELSPLEALQRTSEFHKHRHQGKSFRHKHGHIEQQSPPRHRLSHDSPPPHIIISSPPPLLMKPKNRESSSSTNSKNSDIRYRKHDSMDMLDYAMSPDKHSRNLSPVLEMSSHYTVKKKEKKHRRDKKIKKSSHSPVNRKRKKKMKRRSPSSSLDDLTQETSKSKNDHSPLLSSPDPQLSPWDHSISIPRHSPNKEHYIRESSNFQSIRLPSSPTHVPPSESHRTPRRSPRRSPPPIFSPSQRPSNSPPPSRSHHHRIASSPHTPPVATKTYVQISGRGDDDDHIICNRRSPSLTEISPSPPRQSQSVRMVKMDHHMDRRGSSRRVSPPSSSRHRSRQSSSPSSSSHRRHKSSRDEKARNHSHTRKREKSRDRRSKHSRSMKKSRSRSPLRWVFLSITFKNLIFYRTE